MEERSLSEDESLRLIASMINKAKNSWNENGFLYLLWGWVVLICAIAQYITVTLYHVENGYLVWLLTWGVVLYQIFYLKKNRRRDTVRTYTDVLAAYIWIAFIAGVFVSAFILIRLGIPEMIDSMLLVLYGMPIFISGGLLKFKPLMFGGIFCWILAAVSPFIDPDYRILLIAVAVIGAWIIPGYLLQSRFRMQHKNRNHET